MLAENPIYAQNFEQSEPETTHCENKDQAQALANFLWNEAERHRRDIDAIEEDLYRLDMKWSVRPTRVVRFVKP